MWDLAWFLNLASFFGIAILALPVWKLNLRRKRLQELRDADRPDLPDNAFREKFREKLIGRHENSIDTWRRIDEICLVLGYVSLLGSAFVRLFLPAS